MKNKNTKPNLERRYLLAIEAPTLFKQLVEISEYMDFIKRNPILDALVKENLLKERNVLSKKIKETEKNIFNKTDEVFNELLSQINKPKLLSDDKLKGLIEKYEKCKERESFSSNGQIFTMYSTVNDLIHRLDQLGHFEIAKQYAEKRDTDGHIDIIPNYCPDVDSYLNLKHTYRSQQKSLVWGAVYELDLVHEVIYYLFHPEKEPPSDGNNAVLCIRIQEMKKLSENRHSELYSKPDYPALLRKVHNKLLELFDTPLTASDDKIILVNTNDSPTYYIVVNDDYLDAIKVKKSAKSWKLLYDVAVLKERIHYNTKTHKGLIDTLNGDRNRVATHLKTQLKFIEEIDRILIPSSCLDKPISLKTFNSKRNCSVDN